MGRELIRLKSLAVMLDIIFFLAGCGESTSSHKLPTSVSIYVSPSSLILRLLETQQFTATVSGTTDAAVTWSATAGTISSTGFYTAPENAGSYTVTATSVADTTKFASAAVTVTNLETGECGNTLNWQDSTCQVISSSQQLNTAAVNGVNDPDAWTVISRHGEYIQKETECNVPSQVAVTDGNLVITAAAQSYTCGDWSADGTTRTIPSSWPYVTGDVQWNNFSFLYGTVTLHGRMPAVDTGLWPAFWLLGSNCQNSNKFSGDTGFGGCPNIGQSGYREIDIVENYSGTEQFHVANPSFGIGNGCDVASTWDTDVHTWQLVWTPSSIQLYKDTILRTTCNQAINAPMFLITQIQTGGAGGTPNKSLLPASMMLDYIEVQDPSGATILYDDFTSSP